jgi:hypothetical protein
VRAGEKLRGPMTVTKPVTKAIAKKAIKKKAIKKTAAKKAAVKRAAPKKKRYTRRAGNLRPYVGQANACVLENRSLLEKYDPGTACANFRCFGFGPLTRCDLGKWIFRPLLAQYIRLQNLVLELACPPPEDLRYEK